MSDERSLLQRPEFIPYASWANILDMGFLKENQLDVIEELKDDQENRNDCIESDEMSRGRLVSHYAGFGKLE